jgi:hypothetical protein
MPKLRELRIHEISILSKNVRPAVRAARIVVAKSDGLGPTSASDTDAEPKTFNEAVALVMSRDKCTRLQAMQTVRIAWPGLYDAYQSEGQQRAKDAYDELNPKRIAKSAAVVTFEKRVNEVVLRDQCKKTVAMDRARKEFPEEFTAAYRST